jgi:hypothetical protein
MTAREPARGCVIHIITDFAKRGGTEVMLARLLSATPDRPAHLVSLGGLSSHNRDMVRGDHVTFVEFGAARRRSSAGSTTPTCWV